MTKQQQTIIDVAERAESLNRGYFTHGRTNALSKLFELSVPSVGNILSGRPNKKTEPIIKMLMAMSDKEFINYALTKGLKISHEGDHYSGDDAEGVDPLIINLANRICYFAEGRIDSSGNKKIAPPAKPVAKLIGTTIRNIKKLTPIQQKKANELLDMNSEKFKQELIDRGLI